MEPLKRGSAASLGIAAASATIVLMLGVLAAPVAAQPYVQGGVVHACYKVKGKDRGTLRIVKRAPQCKKLHGWRRVSWGAVGFPGGSAGAGSGGSSGSQGAAGAQGATGPPGEPGQRGEQGVAGEVESSLLETVHDQSEQITSLTNQVSTLGNEVADLEGLLGTEVNDLEGMLTDLGGEVTGLEGQVSSLGGEVTDLGSEVTDLESTVGETCDQLTTLTQQSDDIVSGVTNVSLNNALQLINGAIQFPGLPNQLGSFQCE